MLFDSFFPKVHHGVKKWNGVLNVQRIPKINSCNLEVRKDPGLSKNSSKYFYGSANACEHLILISLQRGINQNLTTIIVNKFLAIEYACFEGLT